MHRSALLLGCLLSVAHGNDAPLPASVSMEKSFPKPFPQPTSVGTKAAAPWSVSSLVAAMAKLRPLHTKFGKPEAGDWVLSHPEPGQTFSQYLRCNPTLPRGKRCVVYVQPLGDLSPGQRTIIDLSAEFLGLYFNLPVKIRRTVPLSQIPDSARRVHPSWGVPQILAPYVMDKILRPRLPSDAAAYIAFTGSDLWPGKGWNFVFGMASIRYRVGVWSIYRNGDPVKEFTLCLRRTLKTAAHETGHMFSLRHCTAYECNMCGSNSRYESDRRPLALCPECAAKVSWATHTDLRTRYNGLARFCKRNDLEKEAAFYRQSASVLKY